MVCLGVKISQDLELVVFTHLFWFVAVRFLVVFKSISSMLAPMQMKGNFITVVLLFFLYRHTNASILIQLRELAAGKRGVSQKKSKIDAFFHKKYIGENLEQSVWNYYLMTNKLNLFQKMTFTKPCPQLNRSITSTCARVLTIVSSNRNKRCLQWLRRD